MMPLSKKPIFGASLIKNHPINRDLITYWILNEGGGNIIYDLANKKNYGTLNSSVVWKQGKSGRVLSFSGGYVAGSCLLSNIKKATITAWIYITSVPGTSSSITTFQNGYMGGPQDKELYVKHDGKLYFYAYSGGRVYTPAPTNTIPLNQWVFVGGMADGINISVWMNGVSISSIACGNTYDSYTTANFFVNGASTLPLSTLTGSIDNIRVHNRALSSKEMWFLYTNPFAGVKIPERRPVMFFLSNWVLKTYIGLPRVSTKTMNAVEIASVKTINGLA